jgi:uncharacterized membrane-anchored protein
MAGGSLWLRAVYRVERLIGERVEAAVHSDEYFDLVTIAQRRQRQARTLAEMVSRRALHLMNLPAGSDIRRLREQLARIDRRLTQIAKELEQDACDGDGFVADVLDRAEMDRRRS